MVVPSIPETTPCPPVTENEPVPPAMAEAVHAGLVEVKSHDVVDIFGIGCDAVRPAVIVRFADPLYWASSSTDRAIHTPEPETV